MLTPYQDVLFIVNVQHNCRDRGCQPSGRRRQRQERQETNIEVPFIEHADDTHYILNTHALHNGALLRKALPRELTQPMPYIADRTEQHRRMAASLRATHDARRKKDADARAARKEKQQAATGTTIAPGPSTTPSGCSDLVPGAAVVADPGTPSGDNASLTLTASTDAMDTC